MRCAFACAALLTVAGRPAAAQQRPDVSAADQEVIAASNAWFDALAKRDATALDRLLAPDFLTIQVGPRGVGVIGKAAQVDSVRKGGGIPPSTRRTLSRVQVRTYGTTAMLTAVAAFEADGPAGAKLRNNAMISELWVNQGGQWRLAHYQPTNAPPPSSGQ